MSAAAQQRKSKYIDHAEAVKLWRVWCHAPRTSAGRRAERALLEAVEPIRLHHVKKYMRVLDRQRDIQEEIDSASWLGVADALRTWDPDRAQFGTWVSRRVFYALTRAARHLGVLGEAYLVAKWWRYAKVEGVDPDSICWFD